jgi:Xaa-Pro aminopeptidase
MFSTSTKPFYAYNPNQKIIRSDYNLKEMLTENPFKLDSQHKNEQVMALKQMLTKLKENNIEVVVFTTPHTKYYIDSLEESNKQDFDLILKNISDEIIVPVYNFHYKYQDENIWYDNQHTVLGGAEIIYNQDFGKIIQQKIKK